MLSVLEPDTEESRRQARHLLQQRRLGLNKDVDTFIYQLERPLDRACPGLNADVRKRELLDHFIDGLPDSVPPPPVVDHYEEDPSQSEPEQQ